MCGVVGGFAHGSGSARVDASALVRMRDTLAHRGPDGEGLWISADRRAGLAHRRLAIVDLAPSAAQPMTNEDGTIWVSYNGELYNHRPLRAELTARGHQFRTDHADTEVIVHAYEEWGIGCLSHLEGMFAFGLVDEGAGHLLLARDRLGVKPLYLAWTPGLLLFASEIKALLKHPAIGAALSPAALYHYFSFLTTPAPLTMFEDIYKLPAGGYLTIERNGRTEAGTFWDPRPDDRIRAELARLSPRAQEEFCVGEVRARLARSVEKQMVADVPLGVMLSGGLDSSITVALMREHLTAPVTTFTVAFSDHTYLNELEPARVVSRHFGTAHHEVLIDEAQALAYVPELIYHQDEPLADWVCIPFAFVSRLARERGTSVVLVGEGSDEQFCGYDHYFRYLQLARLGRGFARLPSAVQRAVAALAGLASDVTGRGVFYADAVGRAAANRELFWGGAIAFWERDKRRLLRSERFGRGARQRVPDALAPFAADTLLDPDSFGVVAAHLDTLDAAFPNADALARMTYLECKLRLPELLLMRVDKITMSASIEARVPFLDHSLVELTMSVPMALKLKKGVPKYLLKRAVQGLLPESVVARRKMGFATPMREWLRGKFGRHAEAVIMRSPLRDEHYLDYGVVADLFARHRAGVDLSLQLWTIYNVTAWFDRWVAQREAA